MSKRQRGLVIFGLMFVVMALIDTVFDMRAWSLWQRLAVSGAAGGCVGLFAVWLQQRRSQR
jgi:hypothetical protein